MKPEINQYMRNVKYKLVVPFRISLTFLEETITFLNSNLYTEKDYYIKQQIVKYYFQFQICGPFCL